jgi:hypothetical protein
MAAAYTWRSIADTFHAQRQTRQNRQPPGLKAASVKVPLQFPQAQTPSFTWAIALARSNIHSNDIAGRYCFPASRRLFSCESAARLTPPTGDKHQASRAWSF